MTNRTLIQWHIVHITAFTNYSNNPRINRCFARILNYPPTTGANIINIASTRQDKVGTQN
jgi:hypothetical protein